MSPDLCQSLQTLGWALDEKHSAANKHFQFSDFVDAFEFMAQIALEAERLGHHPDWRNVYRDVWVTLTTHDAGGLTPLDLALAKSCDRAFDSVIRGK